MRNLARDSTWLVAPLSALALGLGLGLVFVPFLIVGADRAAAFYGAFFAAIVTAVAVIGNARYQDHLKRESDAERDVKERRARLLACFAYISDVTSRLQSVKASWAAVDWDKLAPAEASQLTVRLIADIAVPALKMSPPSYLEFSSVLRPRYAHRVFRALVPHQTILTNFETVQTLAQRGKANLKETAQSIGETIDQGITVMRAARACVSLELREIDDTVDVIRADQQALDQMERDQPIG